MLIVISSGHARMCVAISSWKLSSTPLPADQGVYDAKALFSYSHKPALLPSKPLATDFEHSLSQEAGPWSLASQSVVHGPAASVSPGSLLEKKDPRPHPSPTESESAV